MTYRLQLGLFFLLLLALSALLVWRVTHRAPTIVWQTETIESLSLSFEHPTDLTITPLTDQNKEKSIDFRAEVRAADDRPPYLMTIRHEDGLRLPLSLTKQEMIPMLLGNSEKAFPARFPEFIKLSSNQFEIDSHKAGEVTFTYKSPAGNRTQQRFVVIDKDGNTAIYLSFQSKASDFNALNERYFTRILGSLNLN